MSNITFSVRPQASKQIFNAAQIANVPVPSSTPSNNQSMVYSSTAGRMIYSTVGGTDFGDNVYVVGPVGSGATYNTVTAAAAAVVADGYTSGLEAVIFVMPGEYTENITWGNIGALLYGYQAQIIGSVTVTSSYTIFSGMTFANSTGTVITLTGDRLVLENCFVVGTGSATGISSTGEIILNNCNVDIETGIGIITSGMVNGKVTSKNSNISATTGTCISINGSGSSSFQLTNFRNESETNYTCQSNQGFSGSASCYFYSCILSNDSFTSSTKGCLHLTNDAFSIVMASYLSTGRTTAFPTTDGVIRVDGTSSVKIIGDIFEGPHSSTWGKNATGTVTLETGSLSPS